MQGDGEFSIALKKLKNIVQNGDRDEIMARVLDLEFAHDRELERLRIDNAKLVESIEQLHDVKLEDELCRFRDENDSFRRRVANLKTALKRRKRAIRRLDDRTKRQSQEISKKNEEIQLLKKAVEDLQNLLSLVKLERDEFEAMAEEANEKVSELAEQGGIFGKLAGWRKRWTYNS